MTEDPDPGQIAEDFHKAVNMAPAELERWLKTEESRSVGWAAGEAKSDASGPQSIGHKSGERIVQIKRKAKGDLDKAATITCAR